MTISQYNKKPRIAMMLSAPYSGATLFSILLNRHPRLSSDGEIFPPSGDSNVMCSCGKLQTNCPYYRHICAHMLIASGQSWNPGYFRYVPIYSSFRLLNLGLAGFWNNSILNALRNRYCASSSRIRRIENDFISAQNLLYLNSLSLRNASLYVDGSKSIRRAELLASSGIFDICIIHLVRDGRAFCNSYLKNKRLSSSQLKTPAHMWLESIYRVDTFHARYPEIPILRVHYEDLCRHFSTKLTEVCKFLGFDYDEQMESSLADDNHIIGNRMRKTFSGRVKEDQSWKQELSKQNVTLITDIMREQLARFSYLD